MTYIDLMLAWDMMAGLGGLKISHLSTIRLFLEDGAETASPRQLCGACELRRRYLPADFAVADLLMD